MYPFERFTGDAKKVLTLAQEEAERSKHSYIGTEHLLLALLAQESEASRILTWLGVEVADVRQALRPVVPDQFARFVVWRKNLAVQNVCPSFKSYESPHQRKPAHQVRTGRHP